MGDGNAGGPGNGQMKIQQPSLRDYLQHRRPNTGTLARQPKAGPADAMPKPAPPEAAPRPAAPAPGSPAPAPSAAPPPAAQPAIEVAAGSGIGLSRAADNLRHEIYDKLVRSLDTHRLAAHETEQEQRRAIEDSVEQIIAQEGYQLTRPETMRLMKEVADELLGYGPITELLQDESITEVMVNSPVDIFYERKGRLYRSDRRFRDDEHLRRIIDRIVQPLGRRIDESSPMVDARLPDGSRVNAIIAPLAVKGSSLTIRKFSKHKLTDQDLIRFGAMTPELAEFLKACVGSKLNIVVSGGTGSGKTTFLNVLSTYIPDNERLVTIEDPAELQLTQPNWVSLETRPANIEGKGLVTQRDLVKNALRMRPDRVIIGECRGSEAFDMLQAMNTGHDGSLTTLHANTPRDAIGRIENMVLMANLDLPAKAIREQIASAINMVIQLSRLTDGSRRVTYVTEVVGMEGDVITMQDIFVFRRYGFDEDGKIVGALEPTGIRPNCAEKLAIFGYDLPPDMFVPKDHP